MMTSYPHQQTVHKFNGLNSSLSATDNNLMNILLSNNSSNVQKMNNNPHNMSFQNGQLGYTTNNASPKTSGPSSPTNLTFEQQYETNMMIDEPTPTLDIPNLRRTTTLPFLNKSLNSSLSCKYCNNNDKLCIFCNGNQQKQQFGVKSPPTQSNNNFTSTSPSQSTGNSIISNITLSNSTETAVTDLDKALDRVSPETPCFLQLDINGFLSELNRQPNNTTATDNNNQQIGFYSKGFNNISPAHTVSTSPTTTCGTQQQQQPLFMSNTSGISSNFNNTCSTTTAPIMMQSPSFSGSQFNNAMMERSKLTTLQRSNSFVVSNNNRGSGNNLLSAVVKNQSTISPASPTTSSSYATLNSSPTPSLATLSRKSNSSSSLNNLRGISKQRKTGTLVTETVTTTSSTIQHSVEFPKDFTFVNSGNNVQQTTSSSSNGNSRNQSWTFYKEEAFENDQKSKGCKNNFKFHNISFVHVPEK